MSLSQQWCAASEQHLGCCLTPSRPGRRSGNLPPTAPLLQVARLAAELEAAVAAKAASEEQLKQYKDALEMATDSFFEMEKQLSHQV